MLKPLRRLLLPLLAAAAAAPVPAAAHPHEQDPRPQEEPPEPLIDFLGRRKLCAEIDDILDGAPPPEPSYAAERARLACPSLPAEEAAWRALYAADPLAIAWIDLPPEHFELLHIVVTSEHWEPALIRRIDLTGSSPDGRIRFRLAADTGDEGSPVTSLVLERSGEPAVRLRLSNARFPHLDLDAASIRLLPGREENRYAITIPYGWLRGYCGHVDRDDRPRVAIGVAGKDLSISTVAMTDCSNEHEYLTPEEAASPWVPGARPSSRR